MPFYTLYGAPASLYTGKVRSYLRRQGIDFVEVAPGSERYLTHVVPQVGRWIIPCLETPDGTIIQDGADIIDHFEKGPGQALRTWSVYPESPALLAISHLFELFGGEGLLRPAMHYRWNFDEQNLDFLAAEFALLIPPKPDRTDEETKATFLHNSGRMRNAAVAFGVTPETAPAIEDSFVEWLDLFSAHLADHPYLLGGHPTIGDFGLIAAMWAHLYRDPAPAMLIKQRAPRVGRWVERMTTREPYLHEYGDDVSAELIDDGAIPETLLAMMRYVGEEYLGELAAHVEVANRWLGEHPEIEPGTNGLDDPAARGLTKERGLAGGGVAQFEWRGQQIETSVMPYRFWLMQRLHDDLGQASAAEQQRVGDVFQAGGAAVILGLRTLRRVERAGHLEVWGPEQDLSA